MPTPSRHPDSIWAHVTPARPPAAPLSKAVEADVAVIGGGFTGLSAALHLARAGRSVALLEAAAIGWGASGRNNGQVIPTLTAAEPDAIEARYGAVGERFVRLIRDSADYVFRTIETEEIACEAEQTGWFQPAHTAGRVKLSAARTEAWSRRGAPCRLLDRAEASALLGSNDWHGGMLNPTGGHINPLALARGLAAACERKGVEIFEASPATAVERRDGRWHIATASGELHAGAALLAANAYSDRFAPGLQPQVARSVVPVLSWQMATEPLDEAQRSGVVPGRQAVSDTHRDLRFFRYDARNRLITGGALIFSHNGERRVAARTGAWIEKAFPGLGRPRFTHVWNGHIGMTEDRFPHIYRLGPGLWSWTGCNGRGVALAVSLGRELAAALDGRSPDELALPLSEPKPIPLHGLVRRAAPAMLAWYRWLDARD